MNWLNYLHGSISKGNMFLNFHKCEIWYITCYDQSIHLYIHSGTLKWTNPLNRFHGNYSWYFRMHWIDQSYALNNVYHKCNDIIQGCFYKLYVFHKVNCNKIWNIAKWTNPTKYKKTTKNRLKRETISVQIAKTFCSLHF